jgi:RimJ/RimL family protein N-acetyltransferase
MSFSPPVAPDVVDVILRDGATLRLRVPIRDDEEALVAFFSSLSEQSRHLRFHGGRRVDAQLVEHLLERAEGRGALVGVAASRDEGERIVAVAEYASLRDPEAAEVAFAVADELQGLGVGTRLLERLAANAAAAGVKRFVAEVLPENQAMLSVFAAAGRRATSAPGSRRATTWPSRHPCAPSSRLRPSR